MLKLLVTLLLITSAYSKDCREINLVFEKSELVMELTYVDIGIEYTQLIKKDNLKKVTLKPYRESYDRYVIKMESPQLRCSIVEKEDIVKMTKWMIER